MALTPLSEVVEKYVENLSYAVNGSIAEARLFVAAAQELLLRRASRTNIDGNIVEFNQKSLQTALSEAKLWLSQNAANSVSSATHYYDQTNIRGR